MKPDNLLDWFMAIALAILVTLGLTALTIEVFKVIL